MRGKLQKTTDLGVMVMTVRKRHNLTQVQLASRLGVSQRYLSELETGKPKVLNSKLLEALNLMGIELIFQDKER